MRVLVIGGTALIGPHVIRELSAYGVHDLHTMTRSGKSYYCETSHTVNRRDRKFLQKAISEIKPDVLVDMIPFTTEDANYLVASLDNLHLEIPVIAISSIDVYAAYACLHQTEMLPPQKCPLTEGMELRKELGPEGSEYNKLSIESIYNDNLKNVCILRLPAIYGWPDCTRISNYLSQMLDGVNEIELEQNLGNWKFSRCFHKNAAHAIAISVLAKLSGKHTYNVADEEVYSERQWIQKIANICGWSGSIVETARPDSKTNWEQDFYVSTEEIRSKLNYTDKYPTTDGLVDTIAFHAYQRSGRTYKKYY